MQKAKKKNFAVSVLALSVACGDTSPKGRGKGILRPQASQKQKSYLPYWI